MNNIDFLKLLSGQLGADKRFKNLFTESEKTKLNALIDELNMEKDIINKNKELILRIDELKEENRKLREIKTIYEKTINILENFTKKS